MRVLLVGAETLTPAGANRLTNFLPKSASYISATVLNLASGSTFMARSMTTSQRLDAPAFTLRTGVSAVPLIMAVALGGVRPLSKA